MSELYREHVLKHYAEPYHKGPLRGGPGEVHRGSDVSTVCGDGITIEARIHEGVLTEIWWQGDGCCFSQAAASMLVQHADGKTVDDMRDFRDSELFELFQGIHTLKEMPAEGLHAPTAQIYPAARRGCILVSLKALRKLLETYR